MCRQRNSLSINEILSGYEKFDWFHLDVEGLDAKLLMKTKEEYLPNFIIFEDFNLDAEEKENIYGFFKNKSYSIHSEAGICMVMK